MNESKGGSLLRPGAAPFRLRRRHAAGLLNLVVCAVALGCIGWALFHLVDWAILRGIWNSEDGAACRVPEAGACWAVIHARWRIIVFGLYPHDEQWRSAIACAVIVATGICSCIPWFWSAIRLACLWLAGFGIFTVLMSGGVLGLSKIAVGSWGGLSLTLYVFASVSILGMPIAILLALMRQSKLPWISGTIAFIIDGIRALPLLAVMFTAAVVLPFGLPDWLVGEKLYRIIIAFALYFGCYQAEIIRGGMQSIPAGQDEAAKALGMTYWHRMAYIVLPQAFKNALPPTINQFVIAFLETSLIVIIGFFEVLASGNAAFGTARWGIAKIEVYIFVAVIFFVFTFGLSRYGAYLEQRLAINVKK
jgi:general L-amino acid transport system permease protein